MITYVPSLLIGVLALWAMGLVFYRLPRTYFYAAGWCLLLALECMLWIQMERPPLRTLGETRLGFAVLLPLCGALVARQWRMPWLLHYAILLSGAFIAITLYRPESLEKTLMPALQSPWFVPHVVVYLLAYALLSAASILGIKAALKASARSTMLCAADHAVRAGFAFLTLGLVFGALWAKEAWGHYWTWDPKETWAFITWAAYLFFIHLRQRHPQSETLCAWFLAVAWAVLFLCWFGVNALPSAAQSVHVYAN